MKRNTRTSKSHARRRHAAAATLAAAAVAAVTAGLLASPGAQGTPSGPSDGAPGAGGRPLTLITGDQVLVDRQGRVTGLLPAAGREHVPVRLGQVDGDTYVVPRDAERLIARGVLDQRLFNVTELTRDRYRAAGGLPVIVTYDDGAEPEATRAQLFAAEDAAADAPRPTAELSSINGEALTVSPEDAEATWQAFTRQRARTLAAAPGIASIALDAVVEATLDESVPQVGAPKAWEAGVDGSGVTVAVLDSGITSEHEDVAEKVVAEKNFSSSPDTEDRVGHGTHVASTVAGTGARSDGTYTGVAPGADLLDAKVLDDDGFGQTSWILQGMEWAVAQGADVVNMSLGGTPSPNGTDPLEDAVDALSAESDTLFVVAAGNSGEFGPGTIDSPGTADAALTVGAVTKQDELADFSGRGPRLRDGAVKPDMTAPGVAIAAAAAPGSLLVEELGEVADGYVAVDGTSMATPHVAGAAALLAQQHPDWDGERLKSVLTAATTPGDHTPYEQGTGRLDVPAALAQTVVAEEATLTFGLAEWPHDDDQPITREVTYRNLGERDVTLDLSVEATGPDGAAAPAGTFTVDAERVTVPAGDTATVAVTADTTVPEADGAYTVVVTATDGDQTVRTTGAVQREPESYDLAVSAVDRDGKPATDYWVQLFDVATGDVLDITPDADSPLRLPAGEYLVDAAFFTLDDDGAEVGMDSLVRPRLTVDADTELTLDAREAEPVDVTVPDAEAELYDVNFTYDVTPGGDGAELFGGWYTGPKPQGVRTAQLGELPDGWQMSAALSTSWRADAREYHSADSRDGGFYDGLTAELTEERLARVTVAQGASVPGNTTSLAVADSHTGMGTFDAAYAEAPRTTEVYVQADSDAAWSFSVAQATAEATDLAANAVYSSDYETYEAGREYDETFNVGVFGPRLGEGDGLFRDGDTVGGVVNPLADGAGHLDGDFLPEATTTLYRDGEELGSVADVLDWVTFEVPAEEAEYELVTTLTRDAAVAGVSTRITASYTFTSAAGGDGEPVRLPTAAVRYAPELALDSTGPAGETVRVPVTVQTSAMGDDPSVTVEVSHDGGETWQEAPLTDGAVEVTNPEAGGSVSFRATVADAEGNTTTQTIIDAYRTA